MQLTTVTHTVHIYELRLLLDYAQEAATNGRMFFSFSDDRLKTSCRISLHQKNTHQASHFFFLVYHSPSAHHTPLNPFPRPFVSRQFVNHVCNSQQLSNKALLTGHLAFRHTHAHAQVQSRQFSEGSVAESGADSARSGPAFVSSKGHQGSRCSCACCCAGVPDDESSGGRGGSGPEVFFPRCWDVRDGGVASLLKAFAVSAAAALLRRAVEAEVREECTRKMFGARSFLVGHVA